MIEASLSVLEQLAPTGVIRVAINLGNIVLAQQDAQTGRLRGVSVDLAQALLARVGLEAVFSTFETAGQAFAALKAGACDLGFLAIDPERAADLTFTPPYVVIEGTYLVPQASARRTIESMDSAGIRIAAGKNTAYGLQLSRSLKTARLVHAPSSRAAIDLLVNGGVEAAAGVRQFLLAAAAKRPGFRVLDGRFLEIQQAMAIPNGRPEAARYLDRFIEEMKACGFVAAALAESGQGDAAVAPPQPG